MNDIILIGSSSKLKDELCTLGHKVTSFGRETKIPFDIRNNFKDNFFENIPINSSCYVINVGIINNFNISDYSEEKAWESMNVNCIGIVRICEHILRKNSAARIVIIGSESGKKGSFDTIYFLAKSALSSYVKERYLESPEQQLLIISPSTIEDGLMTTSRKDISRLEEYKSNHPKKRFLKMRELSELVSCILELESSYLTNTEIEFNGGKFSRMKV
ncbi:MAG: SDR family oxidoreductase [Pelagibacteraceae bacterium TMED124]|nr:MAG: SDR family oxidoreductase [Pelagibacteraceae bacterium TMED124]|tara:strand:- start:16113 stop:16763 length:651 start_codon:yes stop_codon:yes gene_type:complete